MGHVSDAAAAEEPPRKWSAYEQESIAIALSRLKVQMEPSPEGKTIDAVRVVALEVFEKRDPAPQFLNWFHTTTRDYVVRREVLMEKGDLYSSRLAAESERNLRGFPQLSVVLVVPIRSPDPGRVSLLVVTKDVWSLRLSWEPEFRNGRLTSLVLAPSETNLFGTTQAVATVLSLSQNTYSLGGRYYVPRVGGSRIASYLSANAIFNCQTGALEGANGYFSYGQPLYSTLAEWSWRTAALWSSGLLRGPARNGVCSGGQLGSRAWLVPNQTLLDGQPWNGDTKVADGASRIDTRYLFPDLLRSESIRGQLNFTRSFNRVNKYNFSFGAEVDFTTTNRPNVDFHPDRVRRFASREVDGAWTSLGALGALRRSPATAPLASPGITASDFDRVYFAYTQPIYPTDRRISPYVQLRSFSATYRRLINYNTLGLQEDVQMGHDVFLRVYPAFRPLSTRDMLGVFASASETRSIGTGLMRVLTSLSLEAAQPEKSDAEVRIAAHGMSPEVSLGRFVANAELTHRPLRYLQRTIPLGGGTVSSSSNGSGGGTGRLRGYLPAVFWSEGVLTLNSEFRSRPVRLFSVLTGFSLFHDAAASIYDESDPGPRVVWRHGAGVGVRFLAPQLDRDVFRIDAGFPLGFPQRDGDAAEFSVIASFGQSFGTPTAPPSVLLPQ